MNKSDYKLHHLIYKNRMKNTMGRDERWNPRKNGSMASWKRCHPPP
jgi:hypothetical protein